MSDLPFTMEQVLYLLHIPVPSRRASFEIKCPNKNCSGERFCIDLEKGTCSCRKCRTGGGILDLYTFYTGVKTRSEARAEIIGLLNSGGSAAFSQYVGSQPQRAVVVNNKIASEGTLNDTYTEFMQKLTLAEDHRRKLRDRGLTNAEIDTFGYKSTPVTGRRALVNKIALSGCTLKGIPGFCLDKEDRWTIRFSERGIMIPVRDLSHRIVGIQVRLDKKEYVNQDGDVKKLPKYLWFSSKKHQGGTSAVSWTHFSGSWSNKKVVCITEGPIKGDILNLLTGIPTLAIPGVSSIEYLSRDLDKLQKMGLQTVYTALDMDYKDVKIKDGQELPSDVFLAYRQILSMISEKGLIYKRMEWPREFKGIDDYLMFQKRGILS